MLKKILAIATVSMIASGVLLGLGAKEVQADEGCASNTTRRATSVLPSRTYPTCALTLCSGYNPTWTKVSTSFSWSTAPMITINYSYVIQGGSISGLPKCRPEIDESAGWHWNG